jgi:cytochrome c oxidase subunit III
VSTVTTTKTTKRTVKPKGAHLGGGNGFRGNGGGGGGGGGGGDDNRDYGSTPEKYRLAMLIAMASIAVMFLALTSAYLFRTSDDWKPIALPSALLVSTVFLGASSFTIEKARKALKISSTDTFKRWLTITAVLGIGFLTSQLFAWQQLVSKGIYLSTNPHSAFFYLLTSLHGVHMLGGLMVLLWLVLKVWLNRFAPERTIGVDLTALYWHFMDGLWIFVFLLLFLWRR